MGLWTAVTSTLDKLLGIRADLVRLDDDWQEWTFPQMLEALRKWCDRNPIHSSDQSVKSRDRFFNSMQGKTTGNRDHVCTVVQLNTSLWTVARQSVWQRGRSTLAIALAPDTEQKSAVSRDVARSVMVDITHKSVTKNIDPQLLLTTYEDVVIYPVVVVNVDGIN